MSVVGTAGHVDHGKSTLLEAITGRDPDRWAEEKRRGLTIDLGFVWTALPSGREVSFVDVPGHQRFIKNMLAGIESVDAALFVVAADEGWMPQSEEHLAVLDLIGLDRAVVAMTKVDRVDSELAELATLEISERLEGTSLEGSPIVGVSAPEGTGLEELVAALDTRIPEPPPPTEPRLWVDRRFTVPGAGTVVTGTLLGGPVAVGDSLMGFPGRESVRIRSIESHETTLERVEAHRRVALNLTGDSTALTRGDMLGLEGHWDPTRRATAAVRTARYAEPLTERGAYQMHVGTSAVEARLRPLDDGFLVTLARPLPLRYGDRFILRETGRRAVVAGGVILDPSPPRRGRPLRSSAGIASDLSPRRAAGALLSIRAIDRLERLLAHTGAVPEAVIAGDVAVDATEANRLSAGVESAVDAYHAAAPLRPGLPMATLVSQLGVPAALAEHLVESHPGIMVDGGFVSRVEHRPNLSETQEAAWAKTRELLDGLMPPLVAELPLDVETLHELVRRGELVRVGQDLVYLPEHAEDVRRAVGSMPDGFTVADFRDAVGVTRKYAVPILEWADSEGLTRRRGDLRTPVGQAPS